MKISVITLVRGRHRHLVNLVQGLNAQQYRPDELVIAWMQTPSSAPLPETNFPVRHIQVDGEALPLARARNQGAAAAQYPGLVFLDVDCIPSPPFLHRYRHALRTGSGLYMGDVVYLPAGAVEADAQGAIDYKALDARAVRHPARPYPPRGGLRWEPDHGQFWGLSFALRAADHDRVRGMDESFIGYGGEDTDYAWRLAAAGIEAYWVGNARAWHQHHTIHYPPLAHFDAIIANARRFKARWQRWCMDYWLAAFAEAGLIDWSPNADDIIVYRQPTEVEIREARLPPQACFG
ncbi:galactosyltransferase-related protein [Salinisphaera sp. SPP-AMP-43]|uniref:glycosyltransferase family 2 protein n=1 Tax=Salinisphaera sp. SPP-AMP-43 TaxID=3121288 RepID=UPI003C6E4259